MAGRSDIQAGRAFVRLFLKNDMTKQLAGALRNAGSQIQSAGRQAVVAGAGIAAAGAAILAPIAMSIKQFASFGDQLDKMSQRTGVGVAALAEFGFAAEQSGTNLETIEKSVRRMQKAIGDAERGLSTAVDAFDTLGLSAQQLAGMSPEDQFQLIADRIKTIEDPTKKASAAMEVFGSRTGTALIPMLDSLGELRKEARDLGIVPTEKAVKDAAAVTDAINRLKRSVSATAFEIGASLAGEVLAAADAAKKIAVQIGAWVRENVSLVKTIVAVGLGLVAVGTAISVLGGGLILAGLALSGLATIVTAIGGTIAFLVSPLGIVAGLLVGGVVLWAKYTASGRNAISTMRMGFGDLLKTARTAFGGIADALSAGDLQLAGEIAFTGLKLAALQGLEAIRSIVGDAVAGIVGKLGGGDISGAWNDALVHLSALWATWSEGVLKTFTGLGEAIINGWAKVTSFISGQILALASTPGFNTLFKAFSGVDVKEQIERGKRLGNEDPLGQAQGFASDDIRSQADAMIDELKRVNEAAKSATKAASEAASAATSEGMSALAKSAAEAAARLEELRGKAAKAKAEAADRTLGEEPGEEPGGGIGAGVSGSGAAVTFSAAAAQAAAFSPASQRQDPALDHWKAIRKNTEESRELAKKAAAEAAEFKLLMKEITRGLEFR